MNSLQGYTEREFLQSVVFWCENIVLIFNWRKQFVSVIVKSKLQLSKRLRLRQCWWNSSDIERQAGYELRISQRKEHTSRHSICFILSSESGNQSLSPSERGFPSCFASESLPSNRLEPSVLPGIYKSKLYRNVWRKSL